MAAVNLGHHGLAPEWERIDLLCHCLALTRRGAEIEPQYLERLRKLQEQVQRLRDDGAWSHLVTAPLSPVEIDVLACVIAPELEPRIGWMYREL